MIYVSLGGNKGAVVEMYSQPTDAYPDGEIFAVFSEEDIAEAIAYGPNYAETIETPEMHAAAEAIRKLWDE